MHDMVHTPRNHESLSQLTITFRGDVKKFGPAGPNAQVTHPPHRSPILQSVIFKTLHYSRLRAARECWQQVCDAVPVALKQIKD
jgi:hypothetical protein